MTALNHYHLTNGSRVDNYQVIEELGTGGAAIVYRVEDLKSGEHRALKLMRSSALADENIQRRFVREVTVMQKLKHANLVRIETSGLYEDSLFYVMELVDMGTLKDVLVRPLPWKDVVDVGIQLADALAVLHDHEIVHRDIKPGNIYLSSAGRIKIGDFGLARDLDASRLTAEGMTVGTVLYMAPEQVRGEETTTRVDLYALGCLLYEMLTCQPPFTGESTASVCEHHLTTPPPNPRDVGIECPIDLVSLIQSLMSKNIDDRPADALEVSRELQRIRDTYTSDVSDPQCESESTAVDELQAVQSSPNGNPTAGTPNLVERLTSRRVATAKSPSWLLLMTIVIGILAVVVLGVVLQTRS